MTQLLFLCMDCAAKKKAIKHEKSRTEMSAAVPWSKPEALIAPHYPAHPGLPSWRRGFLLTVMQRICRLRQRYQLSNPSAENALRGITQPIQSLCAPRLKRDETTSLNFRYLVERHELARAVFSAVNSHLKAKRCFCVAARSWM